MEEFEFRSIEIKKEPLDEKLEDITVPIMNSTTEILKYKCGEIFSTNIGDFMFICTLCNENFTNFQLLSMHIKSFHYPINFINSTVKDKKNIDKKSNELLSSSIKLENGDQQSNLEGLFKCEKTNNEDLYKCEYCQKVFYEINKLENHYIQIHYNEKSLINYNKTLPEYSLNDVKKEETVVVLQATDYYECNICERKFKHRSTYKKHQIIHKGKIRLKCDLCDKSFVDKTYLAHHKRTHTDNKKFICNICGKSFVIGSHLAVHRRIHSGEKPYSCIICKKSFGCTSSLARHRRIHNNDKPFDCVICKMSFRTKDNLIKHESSQRHELNLVKIAGALELNLVETVTGFMNNDCGTISAMESISIEQNIYL